MLKLKKEDARVLAVSYLIFLSAVFFNRNADDVLGVVITIMVITAITALLISFGTEMPWIGFMVIIPCLIVVFIVIILHGSLDALGLFFLFAVFIALIVLSFQFVFYKMKEFIDRCYPNRPRMSIMKRRFLFGSGITFLSMLLTLFLSFR